MLQHKVGVIRRTGGHVVVEDVVMAEVLGVTVDVDDDVIC